MINERVKNAIPLSSSQKELLERRLREAASKIHESRKIPRRAERRYAPLSFAQQRLWLFNQIEPLSTIYNLPTALHLQGRLNIKALEKTINEIVRRHEVLRTRFVVIDGEPQQEVLEATALPLPVIDFSRVAESEREATVRKSVLAESKQPFNLDHGPFLRVKLLRLGDEEHVVLLTMHHIVSDGWSMGLLIKEVATLYEVYSEGTESPLPELPIQYADFAAWQRELLQGEELERQLSYWREQLSGTLPVLELPADRLRATTQTHAGAHRSVELSLETTAQLKELSQREGVTLFMTLVAAFQILLYRYTRQQKIIIGTPVAGRNHTSVENLIGFFINQVALCFNLSGDLTFQQVLQRAKQVTLDALAHQDIPFDKLIEEFQRQRTLSYSPFFQVGFALHNLQATSLEMSGLVPRAVDIEGDVAKLDLMMHVTESENCLRAAIVYSTELFDGTRIERMLRHFETLLQAILVNPEQRVAELSLLREEETDRAIKEWNLTRRDYGPATTVPELFEAQAASRPDAVAAVCGAKQLTYAELNQRVNQLAHYLRKQGVGPEVVVGLCMERSLEMVVGLLGIMKAGGAYLPLDPDYPQQRLEYMLSDAQAVLVLTQDQLLDQLPVHWGLTIVLDNESAAIAREATENPERIGDSENLVYVIYTSGSTGQPKGVMVTHSGLGNLAAAQIEAFGVRPSSRVVQFASLNFDASISEICMTLCQGAQLHLATSEQVLVGPELTQMLQQQEISVATLPPTVLKQLTHGEDFQKLETLIVAGEACGEELVEQWSEGRRFFNAYGPTEATVCATIEECHRGGGRPSIGRAMSNVEVYILDEWLNVLPVGVSGEIYVGGAGIARGYWQRADLTAERFAPHPHRVGARLYRTGDEGRYREDGRIEFLGRRDQQVKVRGFRIELGEIEAVLESHGRIKQAVVAVRDEQQLVAYVVGADGDNWLSSEREVAATLRPFLLERLPEYMVPQRWVVLDHQPLNANGKVDRDRLPEPSNARVHENATETEWTPVEELVAGIWSEVLKREALGREDNFFELGGHSLLATQVISRVREVFGVEVELRRLFETPTVCSFSRSIEEEIRSGAGIIAPPLQRVSAAEREDLGGVLPLSFAQQRMWFLNQLEPDSTSYNIPTAVKLTGELKIEALEQTLSEIVRRHEVLRTRFVNAGGEPRQEVLPAAPIKLAVTDLSAFDETVQQAAVREALTAENREPFDLGVGPMLRVKLLRLSDEEHVVLLTMHHIVSDGWALGVLIREVATLYAAYAEGAESPLPELKVQYSDFAVWQRGWLQGAELERQLGYWREQLGGDLQALELPTDRVRPAAPSNRGAQERYQLSAETTAALRELSRREGVTLFMTLLAGFQTLLHRYSGQEDITVGSPVAGRNYAETENLIGFFVNTLPLRVQMNGAWSFVELLHEVKEVCLGAYAHQDVPFEKLVEELQPRRDGSRSPLYQVVLTLQNAPRMALTLSGLQLEKVDGGLPTSKYELNFSLGETGDGLSGFLQYHEELFEAETIRRLLGDFTRLLELVVENPAAAVGQLRFLSVEEEHEVLVLRNETRRAYESGLRLPEWLARAAQRHWEAVAVVSAGREFTYGELDTAAEAVAKQLHAQGVGEGWRVGLLLPHSYELLVGLLGVLKTGAVYVPLAAGQGEVRNQQLLRDSGVQLVLTQAELQAQVGAEVSQLVWNGAAWEFVAGSSEMAAVESAAGLVYVMYTSGTTGKAKGVEVEEAALLNYLHWALEEYVRGEQLSFGLCTSVSFDLTVTALYLPLLSGGRIVLYEPGAEAVAAVLRENQVEVLKLTPSHLEQLRGQGYEGSRLRRLIVGGEALSEQLARAVVESFGGALELYNEYGPTEATVGCMVHRYELGAERGAGVSIGQAAANTEIYVLDEGLEPVGENVVGEIYIGGTGLARGYWQRAEQTAERFVPHPYSAEGGARLYRSGDLGRWRRGGQLEYVGRRDEQVKYKGHRVELQELRAALNEHADVRESVVRLEREGETAVLVAYYVSRHELAASELREWLSERVVKETVPSVYVHLKKLPLGLNGKVNYQELPGLSEWRRQREQATRAEAGEWTAVEELVAGIWSEVLRLGTVGRSENFFELGGHSLLATQVVSRVREVFGVEVGLRRLFEAPTVRSFSRSIEAALRAEEKVTAPGLRRLTDEERAQWGGQLPLSFAQQRLWFLDQLEPGNTTYNVPLAVKLSGELQVAALERTFNEIVRRHEVLRTRFLIVDGEPRQEVLEVDPIKLAVIDLSGLSEEEQAAPVSEAVSSENREPFDLVHGPMLRAKLLRLDEQEHVVLLTMHHIVSDEWSMAVFVKEVATLYEAFRRGGDSQLPELKVQYADFAVWQRGWLHGEELEKQLAYWRGQLGGTVPALEFPADRARPVLQSYSGGQVSFHLTPAVTAGLKELSRREGVTLFMTMLAAFQTLLHRYSGQDEIVVGTPLAGRNYQETESLIGFFINTLPLRVSMNGEPTFVELLQRVKEVCLGAYAHQDVPFEKLVEELQPERDPSRSPLFQATCMLQNPSREQLQLTGLELSRVGRENPAAKFDLSLALHEKGNELHGSLVYSTDLFENARMERMLRHFEVLLGGIAQNPEQRLWELPLLTGAEREQEIRGWNATQQDFGPTTICQEMFESHVLRMPNAVAVCCGNEQLSYAELNQRANQLAHYLIKQGVGADVLVGLCVERSTDLVVALLGVLKAGGAYVPLDPNYPQSRLEYMLSDSQVELVLTQGHLLDKLESVVMSRSAVDVQWLPLDEGWQVIDSESTENPTPEYEADNLAYVIYTSGSTGQPKGVMLTHGGLHNLASQAERFGIHARSRILQFASLNFDASIFEVCMALCNGGQLHLASSEQLVGPALIELLETQEITAVLLPPTLLKQMNDGEHFQKLETLIAGGEACSEEVVEQWSEGRRFFNAYGPTEATVAATVDECQRGNGRPAIGRGLGNVEVYIFDEWLNVVPVGVSGEIYIGGAGLARGYRERADLTAERFVPHPYSTSDGERLYRTGDEGRYLEDGRIEYLGRLDHQVKVRGYRIELGEIETALETHAGVKQAVVTVRDEQQLVGYVVGVNGESWLSSERELATELRAFLQERLPDYMVPHRWVALDHLPMTANGKIDRKDLPEPTRQEAASSELEPLTPMEKALAGIWSNVLQVEHVGRNDNFFELGGDSILSIQIVSQARQLGIQLSPRDIFRNQTIGALAIVAVAVGLDTSEQEAVEGDVPLTPIQHWFFEREWPNINHFNQSVMLATPPELDVNALEASVSKLLAHHDALRLRYSRTEDTITAYIPAEDTSETFWQVDLSEYSQQFQAREIENSASEAQASLNIQDGPLLRVVYFNLGPHTPGRLLIVIHHLVVDGVSWRILVEDLQATYLQAVNGEELRLPAKTTSIKDWAESLVRYAGSGALGAELDHWTKISNAEIPPLPVDFTERENQELDRRLVSNALSAEETLALLQEVPRFYGTEINDVLIAALARTLSHWSGNNTLLIDLEGHGRESFDAQSNLSRTVGWFTTLHPVLLRVERDCSWTALLQSVAAQLRVAPNNGLGYGVLRYLVDGQTSALLRHGRNAEVCFNYLGQFRQPAKDDTQFSFASESSGQTSSEWGKRTYLIDINCIVAGDRLGVKWSYSKDIHRTEAIEELAQRYLDALREIIACSHPSAAAAAN